MASISSIASSGLTAAMLQLDAAAHNIANAQTPGFRRQQTVQQQAADLGGVTSSITTMPAPGDDLAADMVQERMALYVFKANLRTLQTQDDMLGSLLDVKA